MGKDSDKGKYTAPGGSRTWEYLSAAVCALGMFVLGKTMGWSSPSLAELNVPNSRIQMTPDQASTLTAVTALGQMMGYPVSIFLIDKLGRKKHILLSSLPIMINWVMIMQAGHVMVLIVARTLAGLSIGMISCTASIYLGEILSANIRGSMGTVGWLMFCLGILFMFMVAPHLGVRITAGVCTGSTMLFFICTWFIPESPYFLMMVDRVEEAEAALEKLRGKTDVSDELELIKATLSEKGKSLLKTGETEEGGGEKRQSALRLLFTIRGNLKAYFAGILLVAVQHLCGLITIINYCHAILDAIGPGINTYVASIIFSTLQVFSTGITSFVVDRFGRRPLLFGSGVISGILLGIIGTYFYMTDHMDMDLKRYTMIPLIAIFALVMAANVGIMTLPPVLLGEIFAPDVKTLANCTVMIFGAFCTLLANKFHLMIAIYWGYGHSVPFLSYAFCTLLGTALMVKSIPETKGKTLLDIQKELNE